MTESVKQKIMKMIKAHGHGWAFCAKDFLSVFKRNEIDTALFTLEKEGKIRKLMRGIYDYPIFSRLLNSLISPDLEQVASAIARNLNHEMQPTGNAALNYLKVSTQIPAQYTWLWNGRSQDFRIGDQIIHFKSAPKKDFLPKLLTSRLLVQSLRILGSNSSQSKIRDILKRNFNRKQWAQIQADTVGVPNRIYRQICELAQ